MKHSNLLIGTAIACALAAAHMPSPAQTPVALPCDPAIAAYISTSGTFRSVSLGTTRSLTMASWVSAFGPGESFDFSQMMSRTFLTLGLPDESDWGYFTPEDATLPISINVTDTQHRLGAARLYEVATGRLVGTVTASGGGATCLGTITDDSAIRDYRLELKTSGGQLLANLAIDRGKYDAISWFSVTGGFEPFCPSPIGCAQYTPVAGSDYFTTVGSPTAAEGTKSATTAMGASAGAACLSVSNDSSGGITSTPPVPFCTYARKDVIRDVINLGGRTIGDPTAAANLSSLHNSLLSRDPTLALSSVPVLPYCTGYAYWKISFSGVATGILGVPFERERKGGNMSILASTAAVVLAPHTGYISVLAAAAANDWLANTANQQASKFRRGDVFSIGDVYTLNAQQSTAELRNQAPILAPVTFTLAPDIAPTSGSGNLSVTNNGSWTTPAPPGPANGASLTLMGPTYSGSLQLAKGYKWSVTGCLSSPSGYVAQNQPLQVQTPVSAVSLPCTLTGVIQWKINTATPGAPPGSSSVVIKNAAGIVLAQGMSSLQPDGQYAFLYYPAPVSAPGTYTVEAQRTLWPPFQPLHASASVNIVPALLKEITLTLVP